MPRFFDRHYDRMERGARLLRIPFVGREELDGIVKSAVANSGVSDAYVKICLLSDGALNYYYDAGRGIIAIVVRDYDPRTEPAKVCINEFGKISNSPIHSVKSLNYLENIIARREARLKGYDEAIFLNEKGEIAEGTASNIFWVAEDTLYTPSVNCGILPGIMRELLIETVGTLGLKVEEGGFRPESMTSSRFAALTNSLSGSVLISHLDNTELPLDDGLYKSIKKLMFTELGWV